MKYLALVLSLLLVPLEIYGQNTYEFMRFDISPRVGGLGGSFVANNDDPDVIFYNPAGIKELEKIPVSFSYVNHLLDINFASLSISKEVAGVGRFGAGIKFVNYGTFTAADEYANKTGEYSVNEIALVVGFAETIDEDFNFGVNGKFIHSSIESYSSSAIALDLGLQYIFREANLIVGFSVLNLGTQLSQYIDTKEDLPLDLVLGVSYRLRNVPLKVFLDFHRLNKGGDGFSGKFNNFSIGAEFTLSRVVALRFGYENQKRKELKINDFAGLAGFNFGLGITVQGYQINYNYSSNGEIDAIHRFGVSTSF